MQGARSTAAFGALAWALLSALAPRVALGQDGGVASPPLDAAVGGGARAQGGDGGMPEPGPPPGTRAPDPAREAAPSAPGSGEREGEGDAETLRLTDEAPAPIRYFVEDVVIEGNTRTRARVVRHFVPVRPGDVLDVDDPAVEAVRWHLLGTGWFDDVRLRLRKGSRRGWVVIVVEVVERNTVVVQQLTLGVAEGLNNRVDAHDDLVPYGGLALAETNLLGTGITLAGSVLGSRTQQGFRLEFADPTAFGTPFLLSSSLFVNNAREFFGRNPMVAPGACDSSSGVCDDETVVRSAVVVYRRAGLGLGMGHDLGGSTRYRLEWGGERVHVLFRPDAASEVRGGVPRPIDFSIEDGTSYVSLLRLHLVYDRRNDPGIPTDGLLVHFLGDAGTRLLGSDYDFLRLQGLARKWFPLPWGHHIRIGAYVGVVFGDAPFFYKFHVSDLTDLIPSRALEMQLDRRAPPNLLGTAIADMRTEEVAGRVDLEYGLHLYRGSGFLRAMTGYLGVGLYGLADLDDLQSASIDGYSGPARFPIDMTFDLGLRADTQIGVFQLGISNILGFVAL